MGKNILTAPLAGAVFCLYNKIKAYIKKQNMKKIIWIALAVVIVVGLGIWLFAMRSTTKEPGTGLGSETQTKAAVQSVPQINVNNSQLPNKFPTDVPLEAKAAVTQNFNATNATGMYQATREFISQKTMGDNFTLYKAALKKVGWTVTQVTTDAARSQDIILATKAGNSLTVRIYLDTQNQVRVNISNQTQP
jgi:flagellar basal body-associated protein FliL